MQRKVKRKVLREKKSDKSNKDEIKLMTITEKKKKKNKCSKCGAPLNLRVSQLLGKKQYVIVDTDDMVFIRKKLNERINAESSYDQHKIREIQEKYKILDEVVFS